jgi:hypothetical protein
VADSDDWRVTLSVTSAPAGQAEQSAEQPPGLGQVEEDIRGQVGRGIAVGAGEAQIFLYADTETAAGDAERIARDVLAGHGMMAETAVHRWHPIEERWETPDVPIPQTKAEREAEHQRLVDEEAADAQATGLDQWDVRADLGSHRQAVALARKLEGEGRAVVRRWRFLIVGAADEDEARELAGQIRQEAPPGATVTVERAGVGWAFPPS